VVWFIDPQMNKIFLAMVLRVNVLEVARWSKSGQRQLQTA
jgi:hypothetical protein